MKKRFAVCMAFLFVLAWFAGCRNVPDKLPDDPAELMEFPGLQWNMSPDAIIEALHLQDKDLIEVPADEEQENCYQIRVKGEALGKLFGEDVTYVNFFCFDDYYEGENQGRYGLGQIAALYEPDADMTVVREKLTERYGAESPDRYMQIVPAGTGTTAVYDPSEPNGETFHAVIKQADSASPHFYWGSERKLGDYVTGGIKTTYSDLIKKVSPPDETFDETFDDALQVCNAVSIHMINGVLSEKIKDDDGNPRGFKEVFFDARMLVQAMQRAGDWTEPIS